MSRSSVESDCNVERSPRDFFWDTSTTFIVILLLNLAAADFVFELVRDSEIVCFTDNSSTACLGHLCATNVPSGAYISFFIVFHGFVLLAPHYLWYYHFKRSFSYFFITSSNLKREKEYNTGEYAVMNTQIVRELERTFNSSAIFHYYILKLIIQLIWAIGGFFFSLAFFHQKFGPFFHYSHPPGMEWRIDKDIICLYEILNFLEVVWIIQLVLLLIAVLCQVWALLWCFKIHSRELGAMDIATFGYHYGLSSKYYNIKMFSSRCDSAMKFLCYLVPILDRIVFGGPHIVTSLDFMLIKLYYTDSHLGYVFKESQILQIYNQLCSDDKRRLKIYFKKQNNILADDSEDLGVIYKTKDMIADNEDLMWKFSKQCQQPGIYSDFKMLGLDNPVVLPGTIRGTVLGFSARAPHNESAIEVTFGLPNFASSLARVFKKVTALRFTPDCKFHNKEFCAHKHQQVLTFPEDILALENTTNGEFLDLLKTIWVQPDSEASITTGFIVVGPIAECANIQMTTVDNLLETICGSLCKDAVLLVVRPLQIFNTNVSHVFGSYQPPKSRFEPLEQTYDVIHTVQEWVARKSTLMQASHGLHSPGRRQFMFRLQVASGKVASIIEFTTYRYICNPTQSTQHIHQQESERFNDVDTQNKVSPRETNI